MLTQVKDRVGVGVLFALLTAVLLVLSACSGSGEGSATTAKENDVPSRAYQKISPAEAKAIMDDGSPHIVLDVRTADEYGQGHIPGAILIPDTELASRAEAELPNKDETILVYCRSGRRSAAAAEQLSSMGYTQVFDFGGIVDWPYETTK